MSVRRWEPCLVMERNNRTILCGVRFRSLLKCRPLFRLERIWNKFWSILCWPTFKWYFINMHQVPLCPGGRWGDTAPTHSIDCVWPGNEPWDGPSPDHRGSRPTLVWQTAEGSVYCISYTKRTGTKCRITDFMYVDSGQVHLPTNKELVI